MKFIENIFKNRKLIYQLGKNDFKNRFANTGLGAVWGFLQPFVFMMTYVIVFQFIFKSNVEDAPFIVWYLPGMAMWQFCSESILTASNSIRNYSYLVKKVVFPVDIIPIISLTSSSFIGLFLAMLAMSVNSILGYLPNLIIVVYAIFCAYCFIIAFTRFTSAVVTLVPDFAQLLNIFMQLFFWFVPIIWNLDMIGTGIISNIVKCVPFTYLVEGFRSAFLGSSTIIFESYGIYTFIFWVIVIFFYIWGDYVFKKGRKDFADVL